MPLLLLRSQKRCRSPTAVFRSLLRALSTDRGQSTGAAAPLSRDFPSPLLYRDFIQQSLYHPEFGYFNRPSPPIRRLAQPINFNRLLGQVEYKLELARVYKQLQVDWLTPVEVFAPWYGRALAHYILELRKHDSSIDSSSPLSIVEIGGGTGTLAASILDYVCEVDPVAYSSMSYTTIEISSSLATLQQHYIQAERGHTGCWRLVGGDASLHDTWAAVAAQLPRQHSLSQGHTFVLMSEVLDNLPHDRVVRQNPDAPWQQVAVQAAAAAAADALQQDHSSSSVRRRQRSEQQPQYSELIQPATDPLIQHCLQALQLTHSGSSSSSSSSSSSGSNTLASWLQRTLGLEPEPSQQNNVWLPTWCLQLLQVLHAAAPQHTLIAADFSALPDVKVEGRNAPLVSGRGVQGEVQDYGTVLVPWGAADIFFPTDFDDLGRLYAAAAAAARPAAAAGVAAAAVKQTVLEASGAAAGEGVAGDAAGRGQEVHSEQQQQQGEGPVLQQQQRQKQVSCSHSSTADFMSAFAEAKMTRTLSGYNPLVQDWLNTRIFVGQAA